MRASRKIEYMQVSGLLYFFFFAFSSSFSLFSIWIHKAIGLNGAETGMVFAANTIAAMLILPLGRGTTVQLSEGDFLHIGDYQIAVHLDAHELADDRRHLSQRSLNELLTGRRDGLEDWNAHTLPFLPPTDTNTHICHEFEQLSRPLDPARESDPLLALEAITAAPPLHDVLDFAAHATADQPRVERAKPHRAVHLPAALPECPAWAA